MFKDNEKLSHYVESLLPQPLRGNERLPTTLVELLQTRAELTADLDAFLYLADGESVDNKVSYLTLYQQASAIAAELQKHYSPGSRIMIMCPQGIEYLSGFFACLLADLIAVPAFPPLMNGGVPKLLSMVQDCEPVAALTTEHSLGLIQSIIDETPQFKSLAWHCADTLGKTKEKHKNRIITPEHTAFLQYTSGSTGNPKGVMLSHANLMHNVSATQAAFSHDKNSVNICWAPMYHDMGLIGNALESLFCGIPSYMMSPFSFLQKPIRWLQAISRFKGTTSGGPNFSYDICVRNISEDDCKDLDLSSWDVAFNAAEPLTQKTIESFCEKFSPFGFNPKAILPGFGLAESTVFVSSVNKGFGTQYLNLDKNALLDHQARPASETEDSSNVQIGINCGHTRLDQKMIVVDPESKKAQQNYRVGEIWVSGPSVAQGYWQNEEATEETFANYLADDRERNQAYMRTGDLGFMVDSDIFVTGRIKELIVVRGENIYPQDIEATVEECSDALQVHSGAAFSIDQGEAVERVVLVQELKPRYRKLDLAKIVRDIRAAVSDAHGLDLAEVLLIKPGRMPKTTSGKIQRGECKRQFIAAELDPVHHESFAVAQTTSENTGEGLVWDGSAEGIERWFSSRLISLGVREQEIDLDTAFLSYGLDSATSIQVSGELERFVGKPLDATLLYEFPSIGQLAAHLGTKEVSNKENTSEDDSSAEINASDLEQEPIAIVGMGCRFPGASNPEEFWQLLDNEVDAITEAPEWRWPKSQYFSKENVAGKMNTAWGGFIEGIENFDAGFFGISPREADLMDPQQRLLMMCAQEALDNAGMASERVRGTKTGVFVAITAFDYSLLQLNGPPLKDAYTGTGTGICIASNRLSYFYDWNGPSLSVDTACSSSLVALDLACKSIRRGESEMAMVAGTNAILSPFYSVNFSKADVLSKDGRCKAFDHRANGYIRSEGVAALMLKPLSKALADKDPIVAVIRSTAVHHGGRGNGLMAPNPAIQERVIRDAYHKVGLHPSDVQYVEAHGTGTALGDPMEAKSLAAVMGQGHSASDPCWIGSVKTNIGHTEATAGLAGLMKLVLSMQHDCIPKSLHYQKANPMIPFGSMPLRVASEAMPWPEAKVKRAGLSSFGIGGTLSHAIIEAAPAANEVEETSTKVSVLGVSAHSESALKKRISQLKQLLEAEPENYEDIAYTSISRFASHNYRVSVFAEDCQHAIEKLDSVLNKMDRESLSPVSKKQRTKTAFVLPGQGGQWKGMAQQLWQDFPAFREEVQAIDEALKNECDYSVAEVMTDAEGAPALQGMEIIQPTVFAFQAGLAALLKSWGIWPDAVVGQSVGEIAAAYIAGALTREDAVKVVARRSKILQKIRGKGSMMLVELSVDDAEKRLSEYEGRIGIAVCSAPTETVVAGDSDAIESFAQTLESEQIFCRQVKVDYASHCFHVDPVLAEIEQALSDVKPQASRVPIYSSVERKPIRGNEMDGAYWCKNLRNTVYMSDSIAQLLEKDFTAFIELSPHPILLSSLKQNIDHATQGEHEEHALVAPCVRREGDAAQELAELLSMLHDSGHHVAWDRYYGGKRVPVKFPAYPFSLRRHWFVSEDDYQSHIHTAATSHSAVASHPILGRRIDAPGALAQEIFEKDLRLDEFPFLRDHRIQGQVVLPAALYLEMAISLGRAVLNKQNIHLSDVRFLNTMMLDEDQPIRLLSHATHQDEGVAFQIFGRKNTKESQWGLLASGAIAAATDEEIPTLIHEYESAESRSMQAENFYQDAAERAMEYGENFQLIDELTIQGDRVNAQLITNSQTQDSQYSIHPTSLDTCLQALAGAIMLKDEVYAGRSFLPVAIKEIRVGDIDAAKHVSNLQVNCQLVNEANETLDGNIQLHAPDGELLLSIRELTVQELLNDEEDRIDHMLYDIAWKSSDVEHEPRAVEHESQAVEGNLAVLTDSNSPLFSLADQFGAQASLIVEMANSNSFEGERWQIDPNHEKVYEVLVDQLIAHGINKIVLACGAPFQNNNRFDSNHGPSESLGLVRLLALIQALSLTLSHKTEEFTQPIQLFVMTRMGVNLPGENVSPADAAIHGMLRSVAAEDIGLGLQCIDVSEKPTEKDLDLVQALLSSKIGKETSIAIRKGQYLFPRLKRMERHHMDFSSSNAGEGSMQGVHIISGGLGGLGQETVRQFSQMGASALVLLGRSPLNGEKENILNTLRAEGVSLSYYPVDVADKTALENTFIDIEKDLGEIRGIHHAAGVLSDALFNNQTQESYDTVLHAKCVGAWHLHELSLTRKIDTFVMYSSATSVVGSPGQSNYAAANAFIDALAFSRRQQGLPGSTINWGAWADVGLAAESENRGERLAAKGMLSILPKQGRKILHEVNTLSPAQVVAMPVDWHALVNENPLIAESPIVADMVADIALEENSDELMEMLCSSPEEQWHGLIVDNLKQDIARVVRMESDQLDVNLPLQNYGIDSLMAVELKRRFERKLGVSIAVIKLIKGPSLSVFVSELLADVRERIAENQAAMEAEALLENIDELSEEEMDALLEELACEE